MAKHEKTFHSRRIGSVTARGATIDEIVAKASEQIRRFSGEHDFEVTNVTAVPLLHDADFRNVQIWEADVEFEVEQR